MDNDKLIKVRIPLTEEVFGSEVLWAESLGSNEFRLSNIPFSAKGYAEGDVVKCEFYSEIPEVKGIVKHSGNGTLWLLFANSQTEEAGSILRELHSVGCTYERASEQIAAVTVPPTLDIPFSQLANYLNSVDNNILLGWEIGKQFNRSNPA